MAKSDVKYPNVRNGHPEYIVSVRGTPPENITMLVSAMHSAAILERIYRKPGEGAPGQLKARPERYQDHEPTKEIDL